jgi:hypothetical protein
MTRLLGAAVLAVAMVANYAVQGATVLWKAPNAAIYLGLPSTELEFENPLAGTETVLGHAVLDWRDADYNPLVNPPYDDWSVFTGGGIIDGTATEIWMRQVGQYIWTTTLVPSEIVSIHMTGDQNDGLADVYVDGNKVASLNMNSPVVGGTVLIIVGGLPNTTHKIEVDDVSVTFNTDVHTFGAAALKESPIKWDQPPVTAVATNVFNGWNEISTTVPPYDRAAADDWVCMNTNPVTTIRWWGSFTNWVTNTPPGYLPNAFQITIWTDKAATNGNPSHPDKAIWQVYCTNFSGPKFVGWDIDPRTIGPTGPLTNRVEACFLYEQDLRPFEYFTQPGPTGTVYWLSIAAVYWQGTAGPYPWGWKTRPRDLTSPAPDDAVVITDPPASVIVPGIQYLNGDSLFYQSNSWDLAFELISSYATTVSKWEQPPDLTQTGIDVNDSAEPSPPFLLADDFRCTNPGPLTDITIWGSWLNDQLPDSPSNVIFTLSIHSDIPVGPGGYSMPGQLLWTNAFYPGQFQVTAQTLIFPEGWLDPPNNYIYPADYTCYKYDFYVDPALAFRQAGTPINPVVYWLDVQARPLGAAVPVKFGWKTSRTNQIDDAVWVNAWEPYTGLWNKLVYPPGHPKAGATLDLSFRLATPEQVSETKWSQPPVPYAEGFNGWNELSWYGESQIVADDWVCTTTNPVTDIHWWGSFLNWTQTEPPQLPDQFRITFWTDTPALPTPNSFSHPTQCVWIVTCTNYSYEFVGWDIDPRNANAPPEACFLFHQELKTNEWFHQELNPGGTGPTNIWWISIAAVYYNQFPQYPWGWKTRPRDTNSLAPDDAVRIYRPTAPVPGDFWQGVGEPIYYPYRTNSWDMAFYLTTRAHEDQDFGDAPTTNYPTLLANTGARHFIVPGFCLGVLEDAERDGQPNANATGDDINPPFNPSDEDGVSFATWLIAGTQAWVNVWLTSVASGNGQLDAWVDFNRNGNWESSEKIFNNFTLLSGNNTLNFSVPTNAVLGPTFARFRLSSAGGLLPAGAAADGEVEDYAVTNYQRKPLTNIVITNIWVTNVNANTQKVSLAWTYENDVHYQMRYAPELGTNYASNILWINIGPEIIGPAHEYQESNPIVFTQRCYRVMAPYIVP